MHTLSLYTMLCVIYLVLYNFLEGSLKEHLQPIVAPLSQTRIHLYCHTDRLLGINYTRSSYSDNSTFTSCAYELLLADSVSAVRKLVQLSGYQFTAIADLHKRGEDLLVTTNTLPVTLILSAYLSNAVRKHWNTYVHVHLST